MGERGVMEEKGLWGHEERMPSEAVAWMTQAGILSQTPGFCSTTEAADQQLSDRQLTSQQKLEDREASRI